MSEWQPIETAPKDGFEFFALIDGLPYKAFFDELGRFIRLTHSNRSLGKRYRVHEIDGKELLEVISEGAKDNYQVTQMVWQSGFEHKPTHWMPLPPPPTKD